MDRLEELDKEHTELMKELEGHLTDYGKAKVYSALLLVALKKQNIYKAQLEKLKKDEH